MRIEGGTSAPATPNATSFGHTSGRRLPFEVGSPAVAGRKLDGRRVPRWTDGHIRCGLTQDVDRRRGLPILACLLRRGGAGEIRHAIRLTAPQTQKAHVWSALA
jgi:hypothetical protein